MVIKNVIQARVREYCCYKSTRCQINSMSFVFFFATPFMFTGHCHPGEHKIFARDSINAFVAYHAILLIFI